MSFVYPWLLLLSLLPVAWAVWEWPRSGRRVGLILKALAFLAIALALAQPNLTVYESKVAAAILVDTSASLSPADLQKASETVTRVERSRGRHWTRVIPFARWSRNTSPEEHAGDTWKLRTTAGSEGRGTNIETAIRDGVAALPAGLVPRVVLVSDGNENLGSAARAMWQAQQLGIPIDTVPLGGRARPSIVLDSVSFPTQVFTGERFAIEVTLQAPQDVKAKVEIAAEGKPLGASPVSLAAGVNHFRVQANINTVGAVALTGKISSELGEATFENALTLRRPRAILISRDPETSEEHLLRTLQANQFEVVRSPGGVPEKLDDYQLAIFNNWDIQAVSPERKTAIETFVKRGGGLLWLAGEHNVYVDKKNEPEDPLERTLPARLAPPRTPEGTCVVLIVDKSSSMEGKKMELARLAAIGVVENLRPIDMVGVLIFDNSFQWAVPIRKAEDRPAIKRLISGITPDGGTQIAPALEEAYNRILPHQAVYKHIVLLTDGISEEGDSQNLSRKAMANKVTISTVGLGQDVNRAFLEKVASLAMGKAYFLNDPSGLEQILLRDVQEHTGSTAVEKNIQPRVLKQVEILDGVGIEQAPPLRGYVRFTARSTADAILEADRTDPLLVRWQYGLGRSLVWSSDAKNRWAVNWVAWPGFDRLWGNIFRDLLPHASEAEATADFDRAYNELVVDYRLSRNVPEPARIPDVFAFGPNGFQAPIKVTKVAAGHYRGRLAIGSHQGLFRVRPVAESRAFPEVGFYRQEDELLEYGSNEPLLRQIAETTGGRFNPDLKRIFDAQGRSMESVMRLWPGLLIAALLLNLAELIMRKWKGVVEGTRRLVGAPAPTEAAGD
jgi:Ca-activated chloride channel homolog